MRCAECGAHRALPYRRHGAGICGRCYHRHHLKVCARCGRMGHPAFREGDGIVCSRCSERDPDRHQTCSRCHARAAVACRVNGRPLCRRCGRKLHTCATCGREHVPAAARTDRGPICSNCYRRGREHQCTQCGRLTTQARVAASDTGTWICYRCWVPPVATCCGCGRRKPCARRTAAGRPICSTCRSARRPARTCTQCGRTKAIHTTLPRGPVCGPCYEAIRRAPASCARCRITRPLVGQDATGSGICGPCSGDERNWTCHQCGRVDLLDIEQHCRRCVVRARVRALVSGPDGAVHPQLGRLPSALLQQHAPEQTHHWLVGTQWARLLAELAMSGLPITHAVLDARPQLPHVQYLRRILIDTGVLAARAEHLDSVPSWVEQLVAEQPPPIAALLRRYAAWSVLRRGRSRAASGGRVTASVRRYAHIRIGVAAGFLTWLADTQGVALSAATQSDVDRWLSDGRTTRRRLRDFLRWAHAQGLAADLTVPWLGRTGPAEQIIRDEDRWDLLRRCLHDESIELRLRVAGALLLLYAQTPSRIVELTNEHLSTNGPDDYLVFGAQPALLPPKLATLIRTLDTPSRAPLPSPARRWLFPAPRLDDHPDPGRLALLLNQIGIYTRPARGGALCGLAGDLPAPVLADLLGISINTATRWGAIAGRDWTDYLAARASDSDFPRAHEAIQRRS